MNDSHSYLKDFIKYASLNVLGMIGVSCYILADTFFISKGMGADGVTALNIAIPIYSLIHGTGLMLGMGGATKFAVYKSQGNDKQCSRVFTNAFVMALLAGLIYLIGGVFFSEPLARLLGAEGSVVGLTDTYLKVLMIFAPFFVCNDLFNCFIRNDGSPKLAMIAMLTGSFSNIILDYVFIFPCDMGIFGAILATGLSPVISLCVLSSYKIKKRNSLHFIKSGLDFALCRSSLAIGVPSLVTELSSGIVVLAFNMIILGLAGNTGVAAYAVIANISIVAASIFTGIAQGGQPLISACHGRGDKKGLKAVLRYSITAQIIIACLVVGAIIIFDSQIVAIFNSENIVSLQEMAERGMRIYFVGMFFAGLNIIMSSFFAASERVVPAQVITVLRGFALIVPMAFVMSKLFKLTGVWLSFPVTELIVAVLSVLFYILGRKKQTDILK